MSAKQAPGVCGEAPDSCLKEAGETWLRSSNAEPSRGMPHDKAGLPMHDL